jgi:hypothetical protein
MMIFAPMTDGYARRAIASGTSRRFAALHQIGSN